MSQAIREELVVAGMPLNVYKSARGGDVKKPLVVFFLLHGRYGSAEDIDEIANSVIAQAQDGSEDRELVLVTFDHRNHGRRLTSLKANHAWSPGNTRHNDRHAIDMYSIQTGTARDVSFLIDFLPCYLAPSGERTIAEWGVAGISLGGHATWITLSQGARSEGKVISSWPFIVRRSQSSDGYSDHWVSRLSHPHPAEGASIPFEPPYIPDSLISLVNTFDPASKGYRENGAEKNPFWGKRVLVLSGEIDTLVPWTASRGFVDALEVGPEGVKKISVQQGVGHECTEQMVKEMAAFIKKEVLCV